MYNSRRSLFSNSNTVKVQYLPNVLQFLHYKVIKIYIVLISSEALPVHIYSTSLAKIRAIKCFIPILTIQFYALESRDTELACLELVNKIVGMQPAGLQNSRDAASCVAK